MEGWGGGHLLGSFTSGTLLCASVVTRVYVGNVCVVCVQKCVNTNSIVCLCCRMQFGGLGQLCDGVLGGDDFTQTKELRVWPGYDYVGWSREALGQGSVDIEFHFEKPRLFINMQVNTKMCDCECKMMGL